MHLYPIDDHTVGEKGLLYDDTSRIINQMCIKLVAKHPV